MFADVVLQEATVGLLDVLRQVDEEGKLRRRRRELRHVLDADVLALGCGGRVVLDERQQHLVELRGGDAALARLMYPDGRLQHVEDALLVDDRGEDNRNVVERGELLHQEVAPLLHRVVALLHQVPLVDHDDASLAVADNQVVDVQILRLEPLLGVEHQDADVGILDGADGAHDRVELEVLHRLALLAHAGRVDQIEVHAELVVARANRVARGAGNRGDDVALLAQQGVGHRRLAHVGAADDGDARQLVLLLGRDILGQRLQNGVHHVARAAARHRRDAVGVAQPERIEFVREVNLVVVVHLVADEQHLFRRAAQDVGHHHVEVGDTRRDLDQKEDDVCLVDGQQYLAADFVLEDVLRVDRIAARVDDRELLAVPVGAAVVAVARGAGRGVDDGLTLADEPVEKGAFADIGAAYYCYKTHIP